MTTTVLSSEDIAEITRLLTRCEECLDRVGFNHNGTRVTNPRQQGAATRFYNQAWRIAGNMDSRDFVRLHREVINKRTKQQVNKNI